ncbi:MAG: Type 1 glutamine amidotransferase-like domain-containing protein [Myxococcota bacterium]
MRGRIVFNGNGGSEMIERVAPWVLGSAGGRAPRVLVVTAAWGPGEYDEGPIKEALYQVGVRHTLDDGETQAVENLCAWHVWQAFLARREEVAAVHAEIDAARETLRAWYLERTGFDADMVRTAVGLARTNAGTFKLGGLSLRESVRPDAVRTGPQMLAQAFGREILASIDTLVQNDERMLEALTQAEQQLLARTGLRHDAEWQAERESLSQRILAADVILLFGGNPMSLLEPLRFYDLQPALLETLRRGATFVASSAGALVLCERMIVFDDGSDDPQRRHFQLLDRGLGLVGGLQVLPHCMDRIHTDDPDNLAYLSRRFGDRLCVGLNRESYLHVDLAAHTATSVGEHDGVYVFGVDGVKRRYGVGEGLVLDGG